MRTAPIPTDLAVGAVSGTPVNYLVVKRDENSAGLNARGVDTSLKKLLGCFGCKSSDTKSLAGSISSHSGRLADADPTLVVPHARPPTTSLAPPPTRHTSPRSPPVGSAQGAAPQTVSSPERSHDSFGRWSHAGSYDELSSPGSSNFDVFLREAPVQEREPTGLSKPASSSFTPRMPLTHEQDRIHAYMRAVAEYQERERRSSWANRVKDWLAPPRRFVGIEGLNLTYELPDTMHRPAWPNIPLQLVSESDKRLLKEQGYLSTPSANWPSPGTDWSLSSPSISRRSSSSAQ